MAVVKPMRLGELITFKRGYDLPEKNRVYGEYPVISSSGVSGYHNEYKAEGEGIVTGRYGTLGKMYYVDGGYWPHNTALYVKDFKGNDPQYIYYLLTCLGHIRTSDKSAVPGINRNELHDMYIPAIEDETAQIRVRKLLKSLDNKIEINNKINGKLVAIAKLIYDYWFVQFDFPDVNGNPYKSSGGKMLFNDELNRELPDGWKNDKIGKILKTKLGGTPSTKIKEYWNGNIPWLNSGEVANFPIINSEERINVNAIDNSATALMPKGTCTLSITRHLRASILAVDACANQSVVGIYENEKIKSSYIYPYLVNEIPRLMSLRTGAQQPHINKGIVDASPIILPPSDLLKAYYEKVDSIYKQINNLAFQNKELTGLRDWLLPMLMNGQVTIKDS
jgi:type I restriction enzyme S subunit